MAYIKALATGNPYIKEKMDLDIQVSKLKLLKANHTSQKYRLEDNIVKNYPAQITTMKERLEGYRDDIQTYQQNKFPDKDTFSIKIGNRVYTDKKEAGAALIEICRCAKQPNMAVTIGKYQGFKMNVSFNSFFNKFSISLKGRLTHEVEIGSDLLGNLQRLNNALEALPAKMADVKQKLSNVEHQLETAKMEVKKPFSQEQELKEKQERLAELNALLNMDEKGNEGIGIDEVEVGDKDLNPSQLEKHKETEYFQDTIGASENSIPVVRMLRQAEQKDVKLLPERNNGRISIKEKMAEMNVKVVMEKDNREKRDNTKNKSRDIDE